MNGYASRRPYGALLLASAAAAGSCLSIYNYFASQALHGTDGVLIVIGSTAIMAACALLIAGVTMRAGWIRGVLLSLLLLDVFATGLAAWFLESWLLLAFMAVALLGWALQVPFGPAGVRRTVQAGSVG